MSRPYPELERVTHRHVALPGFRMHVAELGFFAESRVAVGV